MDETAARPTALGRSAVEYGPSSNILSRATGFIDTYDYTLNPYAGCTFGCSYCYAAAFVRDDEKQAAWGQWVRVKENALDLLRRRRRRRGPACGWSGKTIYMSSVTDPYQPLERQLGLTRAILEELAEHHQPRLVIQTRSPLVTRDLDVLGRFAALRVNMTITTDDEEVRKAFEPFCTSIQARLDAIAAVQRAGIATCITLAPLLPVRDAHAFGRRLQATGAERFAAQPFHKPGGRFMAATRAGAIQIMGQHEWEGASYGATLAILRGYLPTLREGKDGFAPD